jgi:hypothetical protein
MAKNSKEGRANRLPWTRRFRDLPDEQPPGWEGPPWPRRGLQLGRVDGTYRKLPRWQLIAVFGVPALIIALIVTAAVFWRPS